MRVLKLTIPFLLGMSACGGGLDLQLVEAAHNRPSNVAVYFTVDTSGGEPVPGLAASDFRIYEDGALVSIDESQQTIINPEVAAEHYTLLLVDMSGSVTESDQVPLIVQAATEFTSTVESHQKVAVYAFDGEEDIHRITDFTGGGGAAAGVSRLGNFRSQDPSTNLHGALVQGTAELTEAFEAADTPLKFGTIVVFTDGTDRASRVSHGEAMDALDEAGFDVFAIGVGNEIDEGTLSNIGYNGYVLVEDSAAITNAFTAIGERIVQQTQRFYLLSYCSPARAGEHEVTIEAVHGELGSGSLTYTFDAEGFGPRCDPNTPPPFDTSGRGTARRRRPRPAGGGARIEVSAGARGSAGGGVDPEAGDY
jgi:hypothetical protein